MKTFEINPWAIVSIIKSSFLKISLVGVICAGSGYLLSYLFPKEYKSQTILLPENSSASGGGLSSLVGGLSNISSLDKTGAVRSDLYPNILNSTPFALYILNQPIQDSEARKYPSVREYVVQRIATEPKSQGDTTKLDISNGPQSGDQIFSLSRTEQSHVKVILNSIHSAIDSKTGLITIECETLDPLVAATLTKLAGQYLISYVDKYRTGKAINESKFLESRVIDIKRRMETVEERLQRYKDSHQNPFLNTAKIEERRLESDFSLAQTLYLDLQRKWEQAKIKVKEEQTILTVLEPPKVSTLTSKPRRLIFAAILGIVGVFASIAFVLLRKVKQNSILVEINE